MASVDLALEEGDMAAATSKAASLTTLKIRNVEIPIALFSTVAKPGKTPQGFTTAGPSGGVLKARPVARAVPVDVPSDSPEVPVRSDPLATLDEVQSVTVFGNTVEWDTGPTPIEMGYPTSDDPDGAAGPLLDAIGEGQAELDAMRSGVPPGIDGVLGGYEARPTFDDGSSLVPSDFGDRVERVQRKLEERGGPLVDGEYGHELYEEGTGKVVRPEDVRRGVRLEDGRFIDCTEQLERIDERTQLDRAEVLGFVDATAVRRTRVKAVYYVGANDEQAPHALRVIFEAMKRSRRMALAKLTKKTRQSLGVIGVADGVLVLIELVWAEDVRDAPARAKRIQQEVVQEREVEQACALIDAMAVSPAVIDGLRDDAIALREELYQRALAGEVATVIEPEQSEPVDMLAEQLAASLAAMGSA